MRFINIKGKNNYFKQTLPCTRLRHTANDQALLCALDLAHDKVKFKFRKRPQMGKHPK